MDKDNDKTFSTDWEESENLPSHSASAGQSLPIPERVRPKTAEYSNIPRTPLKEKYEFLSVLGAGGAGVIYKAKQQPLGRLVAVKMIHSHLVTPTAVKRFQQEATTIGRISHANIISVYDFGVSEDNQPFMVMDYVEGTPLSEILDQAGRLDVDETKSITRQLCDGLAHAHSKGILHRDLKPSNIMMVKAENGPDVAKILDFGLAKIIYGQEEEEGEKEHLTKTGETVGTPAFMSPEQVMGKGLDHRTDLYSLGCVMYHCLTGEPPFVGETKMETMLMHLNSQPEPINPSEGEPLISPYLERIIMKLLEKNPDDRFQSMNELKNALDATDKGLFVTPPKVDVPATQQTAAQTASTAKLPVASVSPMAEAINQVLTYRALLVVLIIIGLVSLPLLISYVWINAYPTKQPAAAPKKPKSKTPVRNGADPWKEDTFNDEAFAGRFDPESHQMSAHHDQEISDNALKCLENAQFLQVLDLHEAHKITDKGIAHLKGVNIGVLNLNKSQVRDGIKEWLPKMTGPDSLPSLVDLNLGETHVTDAVVPTLRLLPKLEVVDLSTNNEITDTGGKQMGKTSWKKLNLARTMVSDASMDAIGSSNDLVWLNLSGTKITDAGVKKLANLSKLQELSLADTSITDESVKVLSKFHGLSILNLSRTKISPKSLAVILKCDQLAYVNISGCQNIPPADGNHFRHEMDKEGRTAELDETAGRE